MDDLQNIKVPTPFKQNVDYMSSEISVYHLYQCWRENNSLAVKSHHDDISVIIPSTVSKRLENICWRRWYKEIKELSVISPSQINWSKDQDITWLYGPKYASTVDFDLHRESGDEEVSERDEDEESLHRLTSRNLARATPIDIPSQEQQQQKTGEDDDYLSSSVDSGETDFSFTSRGSISSVDSDGQVQQQQQKQNQEQSPYTNSLKSALKSLSIGKRGKKVTFNYIVNSREFMNGMSFDYDFLDHQCI